MKTGKYAKERILKMDKLNEEHIITSIPKALRSPWENGEAIKVSDDEWIVRLFHMTKVERGKSIDYVKGKAQNAGFRISEQRKLDNGGMEFHLSRTRHIDFNALKEGFWKNLREFVKEQRNQDYDSLEGVEQTTCFFQYTHILEMAGVDVESIGIDSVLEEG